MGKYGWGVGCVFEVGWVYVMILSGMVIGVVIILLCIRKLLKFLVMLCLVV